MAKHSYRQFAYSHDAKRIIINGEVVAAGSTGDMTVTTTDAAGVLGAISRGITSMKYASATGTFTIQFNDAFKRLLALTITNQGTGSSAPTTNTFYVSGATTGGFAALPANSTAGDKDYGNTYLTVVLGICATPFTATNPATSEVIQIQAEFAA